MNVHPVNTAASTFEALVATARTCPEDPYVDVHLVNLVSILAAHPDNRACVALLHGRNFTRYAGFERTLPLLDAYGVRLYQAYHTRMPAIFLFAKLEDDPPPSPVAPALKVIEIDYDLKAAA